MSSLWRASGSCSRASTHSTPHSRASLIISTRCIRLLCLLLSSIRISRFTRHHHLHRRCDWWIFLEIDAKGGEKSWRSDLGGAHMFIRCIEPCLICVWTWCVGLLALHVYSACMNLCVWTWTRLVICDELCWFANLFIFRLFEFLWFWGCANNVELKLYIIYISCVPRFPLVEETPSKF